MPYRTAIPWNAGGELQVLTFGLGRETFALEAVLVREILDLMPETRVPGADRLVAGVINFRGRIIPLADLRLAFGMEPTASGDSRIIVIELVMDGEPLLIGLKTDRVNEVTTLLERDAEDAPPIGIRWSRDHVRCLVRRDRDVIVLPDLHALFTTLVARGGDQIVH